MSDLYLYVLLRNDMQSLLGLGRACAQVSHATSEFHARFEPLLTQKNLRENASVNGLVSSQLDRIVPPLSDQEYDDNALFKEWRSGTGNFGATIVLEGSIEDIEEAVLMLRALVPAGMVFDPTYPLRDGDTMHLIPVTTCGWAFGRKGDLQAVLKQFPLLRAASVE